jgi:hypothetical protein
MRGIALTFVGFTAAVLSISPAGATMRIAGDPGGLLTTYVERFATAHASGERVIIDGTCLSACTLAIAFLSRGQICVTLNAVLGFHAAWRRIAGGGRVTSPAATHAMYAAYPSTVRKWIDRHGGLTERLILLRGRELAAVLPACSSSPSSAAAGIVHQIRIREVRWPRGKCDDHRARMPELSASAAKPDRVDRVAYRTKCSRATNVSRAAPGLRRP